MAKASKKIIEDRKLDAMAAARVDANRAMLGMTVFADPAGEWIHLDSTNPRARYAKTAVVTMLPERYFV